MHSQSEASVGTGFLHSLSDVAEAFGVVGVGDCAEEEISEVGSTHCTFPLGRRHMEEERIGRGLCMLRGMCT